MQNNKEKKDVGEKMEIEERNSKEITNIINQKKFIIVNITRRIYR